MLRLKGAESFLETSECALRTQQRLSDKKSGLRDVKKRRFYPVLAKIRIKKSGQTEEFYKEKR